MSLKLRVTKITDGVINNSSQKSLTNNVYFNQSNSINKNNYYQITSEKGKLVVKAEFDVNCINKNQIELNSIQRLHLNTAFNDEVTLTNWTPTVAKRAIFVFKISSSSKDPLDENIFKQYLLNLQLPLTVGATYVYKNSNVRFVLIDADYNDCLIDSNTEIIIDGINNGLSSMSILSSVGSNLPSDNKRVTLDFNFSKLGIGGLKSQLDILFRRFFLIRMYSPLTLDKIGIKPVKGMILYGPPGCGKTLIARNIGNSLNCKISIINGPEILNKYVGESESNLRKPFENAKSDPNNLHLIIFDEIDSLCKRRGSSSSTVGDTVVNQLLTLMDGIEEIKNVLVIGLTNRIDLIDDALLRPGRFEVKIYIPLPRYEDRMEIINIHTQKLISSGSLNDFNINKLAQDTEDFSGAELEGLIRDAVTFGMSRNTKDGKLVSEKLELTMDDFNNALNDFKKGSDDYMDYDLSELKLPKKSLVSILIIGNIGSGKTTLAKNIAYKISPHRTVKLIDNLSINRRDKDLYLIDTYNLVKYCSSCALIIDNLELIIEYNPLTAFNNLAYQSILSILRDKPQSKLESSPTILAIVTTSDESMIDRLNMNQHFDVIINMSSSYNFDITQSK